MSVQMPPILMLYLLSFDWQNSFSLCYKYLQRPKTLSYEMLVHNKRYEASYFQAPDPEMMDTLAIQKRVKEVLLREYTQEQIDNPTGKQAEEMQRLVTNQYTMEELVIKCEKNSDGLEKFTELCKAEAEKLLPTIEITNEKISVPCWTDNPGFAELIKAGTHAGHPRPWVPALCFLKRLSFYTATPVRITSS